MENRLFLRFGPKSSASASSATLARWVGDLPCAASYWGDVSPTIPHKLLLYSFVPGGPREISQVLPIPLFIPQDLKDRW